MTSPSINYRLDDNDINISKKVNTNFDDYLNYISQRNNGTASWDSIVTKNPWNDVRAYGVKGDGTNDAGFIQYAIDSISANSILYFPPGTYTISGNIIINKAMTLIGDEATLLFSTDSTTQGVKITASNVSLFNLTISGPQYAIGTSEQTGIWAYGADSAHYLSNIIIKECTITNFGNIGIELDFVDHFNISKSKITDCYNIGIILRSCCKGIINDNIVENIPADLVVGTNAYGITLTKSTGSESAYPVCYYITIINNIIRYVPTHEGISTHGGNHLIVADNVIVEAQTAINLNVYNTTAGSEKSPDYCLVNNNIIERGTLNANSVNAGIAVQGNITSSTLCYGVIIKGNTINGYSDANGGLSGDGAILAYYTQGLLITDNVIRNSGVVGILIRSCDGLLVADNIIDVMTGTSPVKASGTITFGANPSDGDTITINGAIYTFKDAPSGDYSIQRDGSTLATTLANAKAKLNLSTDGRVSLATYDNNTTQISISFDYPGKFGNLFTIAASVATVSGSGLLTSGAYGASGINLKTLSGGNQSTGLISNNQFNLGAAYTGIQAENINTTMHYSSNRFISVGTNYDLMGTGTTSPNEGAYRIEFYDTIRYQITMPTINDGANYSFYVPMPGCTDGMIFFISSDIDLSGLTVQCMARNNYIEIKLYNFTGGAITMGSTYWRISAHLGYL